MKREATGKLISNGGEPKKRVSMTLTNPAWRLLQEEVKETAIPRFQLIGRTAHSFATTGNCASDAHCDQPKQKVAASLSSGSFNQASNKRLNRDRGVMWIQSPELILAQQETLTRLRHPRQELKTFLGSVFEAIAGRPNRNGKKANTPFSKLPVFCQDHSTLILPIPEV